MRGEGGYMSLEGGAVRDTEDEVGCGELVSMMFVCDKVRI